MSTLLIPMGPIDFPWWFIAAIVVFWLAAVTVPAAAPLAVAGVLLAKRRGRSRRRYGLGGYVLGSVLAVATYWTMETAGTVDFDGSFLLAWLPAWLLAVIVSVAARAREPWAS